MLKHLENKFQIIWSVFTSAEVHWKVSKREQRVLFGRSYKYGVLWTFIVKIFHISWWEQKIFGTGMFRGEPNFTFLTKPNLTELYQT